MIFGSKSFVIQLTFIILGVLGLIRSDSYHAPYVIACLFALFCLYGNHLESSTISEKLTVKGMIYTLILSMFLGMMITMANHSIWLKPPMPDIRTAMFYRLYKLFLVTVLFAGSTTSIMNMLVFITFHKYECPIKKRTGEPHQAFLYFVIPFLLMVTVYTVIWLCCYYPAIMSVDAINQVSQILTGNYSNHHPVMHTLLIKAFFAPTYALTGDINRAAAAYIVFQILFLSATFAFLIRTMYDLKFPRALVIVAAAYYLIMPFHIMYSFTIWKDVVFGAFVTLFVVFFVRLLTTEKQSVFDYVGFVISSMAFCLFRSNGLFAFVLFAAVFYFVLKKERKLVICMAVCIVISLLVKHAVFPMFQVTAPDTVEKLSIPLQQVARVFVDNGTVEDADRKLVGNIIDIDEAVEAYNPGISDPIKNLIRDHGNQQFIADNKGALMGMYLRTFVHNPLEYMLAFIDQTKGYWNSGYGQMLWYWDVEDNKFGLVRSIGQERINTAVDEYLWLFYNDPILQIFVSIGLNIWILLLAFYRNAVSHNKLAFMTTIPGVAIIISLLVSTPVFSEFRYVYPIFCLLPFIILMTLSEPCGENADKGHSA